MQIFAKQKFLPRFHESHVIPRKILCILDTLRALMVFVGSQNRICPQLPRVHNYPY